MINVIAMTMVTKNHSFFTNPTNLLINVFID